MKYKVHTSSDFQRRLKNLTTDLRTEEDRLTIKSQQMDAVLSGDWSNKLIPQDYKFAPLSEGGCITVYSDQFLSNDEFFSILDDQWIKENIVYYQQLLKLDKMKVVMVALDRPQFKSHQVGFILSPTAFLPNQMN